MTDFNAMTDEDFRAEVRRFVEDEYPAHLRNPPHRLHWQEGEEWFRIVQKKGWVAPGWPRELGGMGLDASKQIILIEEYERHGVARLPDHGVIMLGPLLIRFGTEAQRARFLPRILSGEDVWCQGYSEPGAGSDLASLRTEAVLEGEDYIVNGQKIWTTLATDANWIFCLVRTDRSARKQEGISFLLIDMKSPGVTVRPIINLGLHDEFCEVFFDNVRVPRENLVGEPNRGWSMAKALLGFERIFLGSPRQSAYALARLRMLAERMGVSEEPDFQERYTRLRCDLEDHKALYETFVAVLRRGESLGADVSMLKLHQSDLFQRITELMLEIGGENAGLLKPMEGNRDLHPAGQFIEARPTTIYGGSSEIQRGILAKAVLELPG
ncbi:acyl-CoA dehydrogenase family protein [Roseomonas sp. GC11]|uniref:acyl-CoA dehydrogenase family protein n=1 Tax=Roseomonas sp. GC11 TaxID=2950546 RepID=UPI002109F2E4|nr:acyl-CoA dehydrogenase family protein [Roseomonas sp. GC11]MCQ4158633.1 acyl-CoA dehydrogenase family protein [Roseomonas sp. GC11]